MTPRILIAERLDDAPASWLAQRAELVRVSPDTPGFDDALATADGVIVRSYTRLDAARLDAAPRLRVIGRAGVGLEQIDLASARSRGIRVVYTPDANTQAVAEYVIGLILDARRPRPTLPPRCDAETFHAMRRHTAGAELASLELGILGFGRIGRRVARLADGIGMPTRAHDIRPADELRAADGLAVPFVDGDTLLEASDVVTVHVDGRAANRGLIGGRALARLRPSALLINTARGSVVEPSALANWLAENRDAGAAAVLDVHHPEPPPPDHPLWDRDNARLLPHNAARTGPALERMSWVVRDVWAVLAGEEPGAAAV